MSELRLLENMRELRSQNEYSQQTVSDKIHVARQTYSMYENGKRMPELKAVCNLASLYHLSVDELLYADLSGSQISEGEPGHHSAFLPDGSRVRLSGAEARMLTNYKDLPPDVQKEIREFILFKKKLHQKDGAASK